MNKDVLVALIASLFCASAYSHCPCSGSKPCDSSKPCNHCAQEQAQTRAAKLPAPVHLLPPPPPMPLSAQARKYLAYIQAKAAREQKKLVEQRAVIQRKHDYHQAMLAKSLERIHIKHFGQPETQQPSLAAIVAVNTTPVVPQAEEVQTQELVQEQQPETLVSVVEPESIITPTTQTTQVDNDKTELEWALLKSIATALTPLIAAYPTERLIPAEPATLTLDEQLDQMHVIATFITKLKIKLEALTQPERDFIKTASFAGNPIARMLARNILSLQSYFESQLNSYKQFKPQPTLVKELKKLTTSCAKEVDALCKELLNA